MEKKFIASPKGEALYPYVEVPDRKFVKDGIYHLYLILDPKNIKEHAEFLNMLYKMTPKGGQVPYKKYVDPKTGEETEKYTVYFKSKFRPNIFDSKGNLVEEKLNLGSGSIIKVSFLPNEYHGKDTGLNLYLHAIQVFKLVEYVGPSAEKYGFTPENEGFEYQNENGFDDMPEQARALMERAQNNKPVTENDLPF